MYNNLGRILALFKSEKVGKKKIHAYIVLIDLKDLTLFHK